MNLALVKLIFSQRLRSRQVDKIVPRGMSVFFPFPSFFFFPFSPFDFSTFLIHCLEWLSRKFKSKSSCCSLSEKETLCIMHKKAKKKKQLIEALIFRVKETEVEIGF